jgi:hypothetical protein
MNVIFTLFLFWLFFRVGEKKSAKSTASTSGARGGYASSVRRLVQRGMEESDATLSLRAYHPVYAVHAVRPVRRPIVHVTSNAARRPVALGVRGAP